MMTSLVVAASAPHLPASSVTFAIAAVLLRGSIVGDTPRASSVLLLHGMRGDGQQIAGRARCRSDFGYGVLLIDQQAHGESANERISVIVHEAEGMRPRWLASVANSRASKPASPASRSTIE